MPIQTPPTIDALPPPPDPNDRTTFNNRAYPWSVAQQTLATQVAAVAANVQNNATEAQAQATSAADSRSAASASESSALLSKNAAAGSASSAAASAATATTKAVEASVSAASAASYASQAQAVSPDSPIRLNTRAVTANFSVPAGYNAASAGPISVADGVTVTVSNFSTWSIQ